MIRELGESPARRVLAVDDEGRLQGILTARDVTAWLALRTCRFQRSENLA